MAIDLDKNGYLRTRNGIVQGAIVGLAFIAGLINIFHGLGWYGGFIFWSTFFISGFFLALRVFDVHAGLAAKFGWFVKAEFGYCAIWILLYIIATIYSFLPLSFGAAMIVGYIILGLMAVDVFFRYRIYRGSAGGPSGPAETIEQA